MDAGLFDRIAIVDWSASATPKTGSDSIWIAVVDCDGVTVDNVSTRRAALDAMAGLAEPGHRTLLGVDFSLGFPVGTAASLGLSGVAWRATWTLLGAEITDDERNRNNRFEVAARLNAVMNADGDAHPGPFWGCSPAAACERLQPTKPARLDHWPSDWRHVEGRLRDAGRQPFSAWQLLGVGAVGSQSLLGIAALERLCWNLGDRVAVWPFDIGFGPLVGTAELVVAEVWPSMWDIKVPHGMVKDAAQVESTAGQLYALDARGELAPLFEPSMPRREHHEVLDEEGWILGVR